VVATADRRLADGVRRDGALVPSRTIVSLVRDQRGRPSMIYAMSAPTILATGDPAGVLHALAGVRLSPRETAVLEGLAEGLTTQDLAHRLDLTPQGVEYHVRKLVTIFGAANRTAVVARAYATGLLVVGLWPPRVAGRDAVSGPDGPGR
jgi:DNA-binding NarL/FixJ family response regulator